MAYSNTCISWGAGGGDKSEQIFMAQRYTQQCLVDIHIQIKHNPYWCMTSCMQKFVIFELMTKFFEGLIVKFGNFYDKMAVAQQPMGLPP